MNIVVYIPKRTHIVISDVLVLLNTTDCTLVNLARNNMHNAIKQSLETLVYI